MNTGTIITRALNRAHLSVDDIDFRDMAKDMLDEIIQARWQAKKYKFRIRPFTLSTASGTTEYALDKQVASVQELVPNSFKGSSPYRDIEYLPDHEIKRRYNDLTTSGDPYKFYESQVKGFSNNPSSASVVTFVSSLANYTTGTVTVVNGSRQITFSGSTITLDMLGRWIRIGTDTKAYRLIRREGNSSTIFYLDSEYEGASASGASFVLGDINQKCSVLGIVAGQLQEEEIQLNGASSVATVKQFTSLLRISKDGKTHGYITASSNAAGVTNVILDPGETEVDIVCVNFYPVPNSIETLNYGAYVRHPYLYKDSDSPLFPSQYHNGLVLDLYIKLMTEWKKQDVSEIVLAERDRIWSNMDDVENSTDNWTTRQESDDDSERSRLNNLPGTFDRQDDN